MSSKAISTKLISKVLVFTLFLGLSLFIPAGTIIWIEAWIYLILWDLFLIGVITYLEKNNPELLKKRTDLKPKEKIDIIIIILLFVFMIPTFILPGFDSVRFQWSVVPFPIKIIGFSGLLISAVIYFLVLKENSFLSKAIEIQEHHRVITLGLYKYVRHPMYMGIIIFLICHCLALGSLFSLIPAGLMIITFILRTFFEDKMLQQELEGYKEYTKITKYRIIPYIW